MIVFQILDKSFLFVDNSQVHLGRVYVNLHESAPENKSIELYPFNNCDEKFSSLQMNQHRMPLRCQVKKRDG